MDAAAEINNAYVLGSNSNNPPISCRFCSPDNAQITDPMTNARRALENAWVTNKIIAAP
ncbi:hypothetical protein FACS1894122_15010 [Alphaproteobacteria bacterium]|nr:hypothetical protein FACS1894122_15010 [Alphaproteobacteria bacterium]